MERERTSIDDRVVPEGMAPPGRAPLAAREQGTPPEPLAARRRSVRTLLAAWVVYWVALVLVQVVPAAWAIWRASRAAEHGSVTIARSGDGLTMTAWVVIPPLLMTLVWLFGTRRDRG